MLDFVRELFSFMRARRKFWLIPVVAIIGTLGALVVFAKGSAIAPFIYTLF
jgi:hypothetical protein